MATNADTQTDTRRESDRIQRAESVDGTEISARVHGQGPPLVLTRDERMEHLRQEVEQAAEGDPS